MSESIVAHITSVRIIERGTHSAVHIWVNGGKAGVLVLRNEEVSSFVHQLSADCVEREGGSPG